MFNHAIRYYELPLNPARRAGSIGEEESKEMLFWTRDEYQKFADEMMKRPEYYYAFEVLYWCGIREGELLALTPSDFDFDRKTLRINKNYQKLDGKELIQTTKTRYGNRTIRIPAFLSDEIQDYLKRKTLDRKVRVKNRKTGEYSTQLKKGYDASLAPLVLKRLNDRGYIDDERFAATWVENRNVSKGTSIKKLRLELQQKGISQSVIEKVLAESGRDESAELRKIIARKAKKYPDEQKLIQYLLRQGFNYSDILDELSSIASSSV